MKPPGPSDTKRGAASDTSLPVICPWSVVLTGYSLASSTTKTGCHDIAEILLKVALNTKNQKSK
jgi:hypothetical protein